MSGIAEGIRISYQRDGDNGTYIAFAPLDPGPFAIALKDAVDRAAQMLKVSIGRDILGIAPGDFEIYGGRP